MGRLALLILGLLLPCMGLSSIHSREDVRAWAIDAILEHRSAVRRSHLKAMVTICWKESRYNSTAQNPTSTAFGLYQFLDSTWGNYGFTKTKDPRTQTRAAYTYITRRYGNPVNALRFHKRNGYY